MEPKYEDILKPSQNVSHVFEYPTKQLLIDRIKKLENREHL